MPEAAMSETTMKATTVKASVEPTAVAAMPTMSGEGKSRHDRDQDREYHPTHEDFLQVVLVARGADDVRGRLNRP